jgi:hypothetical protein
LRERSGNASEHDKRDDCRTDRSHSSHSQCPSNAPSVQSRSRLSSFLQGDAHIGHSRSGVTVRGIESRRAK